MIGKEELNYIRAEISDDGVVKLIDSNGVRIGGVRHVEIDAGMGLDGGGVVTTYKVTLLGKDSCARTVFNNRPREQKESE